MLASLEWRNSLTGWGGRGLVKTSTLTEAIQENTYSAKQTRRHLIGWEGCGENIGVTRSHNTTEHYAQNMMRTEALVSVTAEV